MSKRILVGLLVALSAMSMAGVTVRGVKGQGAAAKPNSQTSFAVDVMNVRAANGSVRTLGKFEFKAVMVSATEPPARMSIVAGAVRSFVKDGRQAAFTSDAVMRVMTPTGERTTRGVLTVRVNDRKRDGQGEADMLAVKFVPQGGLKAFEWAGLVVRGDVSVYELTRN